jgi:hypothetical protein
MNIFRLLNLSIFPRHRRPTINSKLMKNETRVVTVHETCGVNIMRTDGAALSLHLIQMPACFSVPFSLVA